MAKRISPKNILTTSILILVGLFLLFSSFYTYWNSAPAEQTCASCHEIAPRVTSLSHSAHRDLSCKECHGTALSNGLHSLREKSKMIIGHVKGSHADKVKMNEEQYIKVMESCAKCHASEFAHWRSGRHSATYTDIFLDEKHNSIEQLNFDCLRCHGMFFEGTIDDLMDNTSTQGPWNLRDKKKTTHPTMPCSACHTIHTESETGKAPEASFFIRADNMHVPVEMLFKANITHQGKEIHVSDDPQMRNCVQCHAPNSFHISGTSDDRTPRGVHEGLSCLSCHEPHNNDAKNSCIKCHPAISNCNLDVTQMNTTFSKADSPNNIHWVSCTDCHGQNDNRIFLSQKQKGK